MAWVNNTSWSKEVQKILDAPTYDDQMKLALKYISHLEVEVSELKNEVEKQKELATKYKKAVDNIDLSQHVLQFNPDEFLAWAREANRKAKYNGIRIGKKKQKEDDDMRRAMKDSWNNYNGM